MWTSCNASIGFVPCLNSCIPEMVPYRSRLRMYQGPANAETNTSAIPKSRHLRRRIQTDIGRGTKAMKYALVSNPIANTPDANSARRTLGPSRSEEHTSELQSLRHLVC